MTMSRKAPVTIVKHVKMPKSAVGLKLETVMHRKPPARIPVVITIPSPTPRTAASIASAHDRPRASSA